MKPQDVIRKKRDGGGLTREEINFFVEGVTRGTLADYQASALLMAVFLNGMSGEETAWLTEAMLRSAGFTILAHPEDEVYVCRRGERSEWAGAVYPAKGK